jgi:hypothetical protein
MATLAPVLRPAAPIGSRQLKECRVVAIRRAAACVFWWQARRSPMPLTARPPSNDNLPDHLAPRTLDDLAARGCDELLALYREAVTPPVGRLVGDLRGRMLAIRGAGGWLSACLRAFAAWRLFPWRGKSFQPRSDGRGDGINRVFSDRRPRRWFRFETFLGPSRAGDFDAFQLDYDNPDNPFFIRAIKDEVREVGPGLYLGQAYVVLFGKPRLALYFGLSEK